MPKRPSKARSCTGKVPHSSKDKALSAALAAKRGGAFRVQAYKCRFCSSWHWGHPMRRK